MSKIYVCSNADWNVEHVSESKTGLIFLPVVDVRQFFSAKKTKVFKTIRKSKNCSPFRSRCFHGNWVDAITFVLHPRPFSFKINTKKSRNLFSFHATRAGESVLFVSSNLFYLASSSKHFLVNKSSSNVCEASFIVLLHLLVNFIRIISKFWCKPLSLEALFNSWKWKSFLWKTKALKKT